MTNPHKKKEAASLSCAAEVDRDSLSLAAALSQMRSVVRPLDQSETVALRDAVGRVVTADIHAPITTPGSDNSAMDGYAVKSAGLANNVKLRLIGEARAGHPFHGRVATDECVRIMTGAPLPVGTDTVVMQELASVQDDVVTIRGPHKRGAFVRVAGQDVRAGQCVVKAGRLLDAASLGLLASVGIAKVCVVRRLRVVYFSSGDELRAVDVRGDTGDAGIAGNGDECDEGGSVHGNALRPGEVYDSNRYALRALLAALGPGVQAVDLGLVTDDAGETRTMLKRAATAGDVVIATGGASVGDADHVRPAVQSLGRVYFCKVAMKPGRPLTFGALGDALFFGLPGNPVSVMVTFMQFVRPALQRRMGMKETRPLCIAARLQAPLHKKIGRLEFQRGILSENDDDDNTLHVLPIKNQDSAVLSTMEKANCFIVLPLTCGDLEAGAIVQVEPFYTWL